MVFDRLVEAIDSGSADFLLWAPSSSSCYVRPGIQPIQKDQVRSGLFALRGVLHALRHKAKLYLGLEQFAPRAGVPAFLGFGNFVPLIVARFGSVDPT